MELGYVGGVQLSLFALVVAFFHVSEYLLAAAIHGRSNVSWNSFLISKQYIFAMLFALLEYFIEIYLFPELKDLWWISSVGSVMVLVGEIIRKTGILTAGRSFTHIIRVYFGEHHELITWGIYRFMRHPGYCGFFIWAAGTQLILCNPISTIGFIAVTWRFFSTRIPYEEFFLRQFFGTQYMEYAQQVPSGLPFIK
ncbi:probable protein-S-isoprenylcysteine O-methyltransferase [Phalaenopsis equestris]|uniref:probable protein-S-isoprenylcysteine O-methyltransferase n=1 Tax=Phalaenopsis equestris TaxID=78828 RepID=UPI0009E656C4|nr:probable protein-S-isoprenylcysteine O-methyltransferase [Phalaenopsis equestris]